MFACCCARNSPSRSKPPKPGKQDHWKPKNLFSEGLLKDSPAPTDSATEPEPPRPRQPKLAAQDQSKRKNLLLSCSAIKPCQHWRSHSMSQSVHDLMTAPSKNATLKILKLQQSTRWICQTRRQNQSSRAHRLIYDLLLRLR